MADTAARLAIGRFTPGGVAGRRLPALLASRLVEQAALGGASLLLAWRLGPAAFAPISALFVANSAAVTLSDYGVGLAVLRRSPTELIDANSLTRTRQVNLAVAVAGLVVGLVHGGAVGIVIAGSGLLWALSAEAFIRKAAVISSGDGHRSAVAELLGALAFIVPVLLFAEGDAALAVVAGALVAKHLVEIAAVREALGCFAPEGVSSRWHTLWATQALAYAIGNVDYVIVAVVLGAKAFAIYTLAYRLAMVVPSVVGYVATRTAVTDLGSLPPGDVRQRTFVGYVRALFSAGLVGALAVAGCVVVLGPMLGARWDLVIPTVLVMSVAIPWRMIAGQAGALVIATDGASALMRWEIVRLAASVLTLGVAAMIGYWPFVGIASVVWVCATLLLHAAAVRLAGMREWRALRWFALLSMLLTVVLSVVGATW